MNKNRAPFISSHDRLKKLRTALAIGRGCQVLASLQLEAEGTISHDVTKRVTYLTGLFSRIHREMFQDWREQTTVSHRPGTIVDADNRQKFRKTIARLVLDEDNNRDTAIFDNNGFVIYTETIAERLADFYAKMREVRPFGYGNRITLDLFITLLGKLPAFKSVYPHGIDFRRIDQNDSQALHGPDSAHPLLTIAFLHALDPLRNKVLNNTPNGYGKWPENKKFISGIPFLSHTTADGVKCLVTVNGALMPIELIREELFIAGKHIADYPYCTPENIIGYLPGTEDLRQPGKTEIDGITLGDTGSAPLFCLDINMLTGLRSPSHIELQELIRECVGEKKPVFVLANNEVLKQELIKAANGDQRLVRSVEIAYERLAKVIRILDAAEAEIFSGKTPDSNPKLFMAMGGAGAGKTAVQEIAHASCGGNYVIASLDDFRKKSDLYKVLTAANHHSDDYVYVEPFANRLRDSVAMRAKQHRINLMYDGTGIPYSPRYSGIIANFKQAGFTTQIIAVDAFLVKPEGREHELSRLSVVGSVKKRFGKTGRALPWVITIYKHIHAPESFLNAFDDMNLDKIVLFANDGDRTNQYLVAESFELSDHEIDMIKEHQQSGSLAKYLTGLSKNREDSVYRNFSADDKNLLKELINRNPERGENNAAYLITNGNKVLAIYNARRLVDFIEKRQLNPNASYEAGLVHKSASLSFHVDPDSDTPWLVRLQDAFQG
ncbi:zeta toxin family protein [Methylicorpusculum oleiharenae]|uniref:zeta toxin family protein n=1 Tax=Methylicorpusculum oleiharenae TaxID=1338687 RepID=UPI00135C7722|nr:zeta toxin family protein [Methylicorpusculum oleiharenae]MCD2451704.1 zeta toxin family protein [Methylicorpusculum oleiharenae]